MKEWFITQFNQIMDVISRLSASHFNIIPLFHIPLFIIGSLVICLILLFLRLRRLLVLLIGLGLLSVDWSFFVGKYGSFGLVPFANWFYTLGLGIIIIAASFYYAFVMLGD